MGTIASDILIVLVSAKILFDMGTQGVIPQSLYLLSSIFIPLLLGLNMPVARQVIREGVSAVTIILYVGYFFYLKKYGAPGGVLFDSYYGFAMVLLFLYFTAKVIRPSRLNILVITFVILVIIFTFLMLVKQ